MIVFGNVEVKVFSQLKLGTNIGKIKLRQGQVLPIINFYPGHILVQLPEIGEDYYAALDLNHPQQLLGNADEDAFVSFFMIGEPDIFSRGGELYFHLRNAEISITSIQELTPHSRYAAESLKRIILSNDKVMLVFPNTYSTSWDNNLICYAELMGTGYIYKVIDLTTADYRKG